MSLCTPIPRPKPPAPNSRLGAPKAGPAAPTATGNSQPTGQAPAASGQ